jgi:hypothetical protein
MAFPSIVDAVSGISSLQPILSRLNIVMLSEACFEVL